jgi:hypothetical protein
LDCRSTGTADLGKGWEIRDASAERRLLCIWQYPVSSQEVVSVIDAANGKTLRQFASPPAGWDPFESSLSVERFADGGNAVCGVGGTWWHSTVRCEDLDSGKELGATKRWTHPDLRTALHARRAVLSDYGTRLDGDLQWEVGSLKRRVVWDFGTGKEVVSWRPKSQTALVTLPKGVDAHERSVPYQFAISPDGEYVVEGGAGTVSLYRIEP